MERPLILKGKRVGLSPREERDWELLYREVNDPEVNMYLGSPVGRGMYTEVEEREYVKGSLKDKEGRHFTIISLESGEPVGTLSLVKIDPWNRNAEIGYFVFKRYWGKGYATEAVKLALEFSFRILGLEKVYAYVAEVNKASRRVLEKNGFREVGRLRRHLSVPGRGYVDVVIYDVLREEWEERNTGAP